METPPCEFPSHIYEGLCNICYFELGYVLLCNFNSVNFLKQSNKIVECRNLKHVKFKL